MRKIVFITGTRADFGKIKSLIHGLDNHTNFEVFVFVTGMHLQEQYGYTFIEIERCNFKNVYQFENSTNETTMDLSLAKTIEGFSNYCKTIMPDMIVVHGDRIETMAGAIVGSLNNILVAHIEGGELSGTVDELIRHSVSKLSHLHFVSNKGAKNRLIQMGELESSIFIIGSPDVDIMFSNNLPEIRVVKTYYEIPFDTYGIVMFHPVTTEVVEMKSYTENLIKSLKKDSHNYIIIYPNNDMGSQDIINQYLSLKQLKRFRVIPSLRFEYFLTLLKNAQFVIGNSSVGIREAPYYGVPIINIGTRQQNRALNADILNVSYSCKEIDAALSLIDSHKTQEVSTNFGKGNSTSLFLKVLNTETFWNTNHQKQFRDGLYI